MRRLAALVAAASLAGGAARAQMTMGPPSEAAPFGSPVADQQVFSHLSVDQFEGRIGDQGTSLRWDAEGWTGSDDLRLWLKTEGERLPSGDIEDGQQEVLLAKPVSTYWDVQVGGRYDLDSGPGRAWAAIGVEGLAPGMFNVAATAYVGEKGMAGKLKASYDLLLTDRLVLQPEAELNLYGSNDRARQIAAGVSDLDAGLRLRYEITRKFAPYVGVAWERKFGQTANFVRAVGRPADAARLAVGVKAWF